MKFMGAARFIKKRFPDEIVKKLENIEWWDLPEKILNNLVSILQIRRNL